MKNKLRKFKLVDHDWTTYKLRSIVKVDDTHLKYNQLNTGISTLGYIFMLFKPTEQHCIYVFKNMKLQKFNLEYKSCTWRLRSAHSSNSHCVNYVLYNGLSITIMPIITMACSQLA